MSELGERGTCRGCGKPIVWVRNKFGRVVPYTPAGLSHFIDCPKAADFRKER